MGTYQARWHMLLIPIPRRQKRVNLFEVKASVFYIASSRPARDTCSGHLSNTKFLGLKKSNKQTKKIVVTQAFHPCP